MASPAGDRWIESWGEAGDFDLFRFDLRGLLFDLDPILGAFTVTVSIVSMAEYARKARWINLLPSLILLIAAWVSFSHVAIHSAIAILIGLLSIRKGPIRERSSFQS